MGYIDEDKIQLDISDHCVVRAWFKVNPRENKNWKNKGYKEISWIAKEEDRMIDFERSFIPKIGRHFSFKRCMGKIKQSMEQTMRRKKKIKQGRRGKETILAAEWVDQELIDQIQQTMEICQEKRRTRRGDQAV